MAKQLQQFSPHGQLERVGRGTDELLAIKRGTQAHHMGRQRQTRLEQARHRITLPLDRVARDSAPGAACGHRGAQPDFMHSKQGLRPLHRWQGVGP